DPFGMLIKRLFRPLHERSCRRGAFRNSDPLIRRVRYIKAVVIFEDLWCPEPAFAKNIRRTKGRVWRWLPALQVFRRVYPESCIGIRTCTIQIVRSPVGEDCRVSEFDHVV